TLNFELRKEHRVKRALLFVGGLVCLVAGFALAVAAHPTSANSQSILGNPQSVIYSPQQGTPTPTPCVTTYTCTNIPSATIVPGTTDIGNHYDDCVTNVTLPFPVQLYGTLYTSVNVSSNGNAQFVSNEADFHIV